MFRPTDVEDALAELEARIDELLTERQDLVRMPRAKRAVEAGMLNALIESAARGSRAIDEKIQLAQRRDQNPEQDCLWDGMSIDSDVVAYFMEKQLTDTIKSRCKRLPTGIEDADRESRLAEIARELDEVRAVRDKVQRAA